MPIAAPSCTACGGVFACVNCERSLRRQLHTMHEVDQLVMHGGGTSVVHPFFDAMTARRLYETRFPTGPRGGALISFGNAITLECFLPYEEPDGTVWPLMPMPLTGREIIHDIGRKKAVMPWELDACLRGACRCSARPRGWLLTRPIVRALLGGITDSWLNDHGRQLPGHIGTLWGLAYTTLVFMQQCYFNPAFVLPTRAEDREARAHRARLRGATRWKHTHPGHSRRARRRK